jgi:hypothetical protein
MAARGEIKKRKVGKERGHICFADTQKIFFLDKKKNHGSITSVYCSFGCSIQKTIQKKTKK